MTDYAREFENKMFDSFNKGQRQGDGQILVPRIVVCPTVFKKPCRLCELCKQVFKTAKGTPLEEKASNYYRKFRYYSNIVFPAVNPSEVIAFEYGKKILEKLMGYHMDPNSEYKGFLDPVSGRNLVIIKRINTIDKKKTSYDVEPRIQTSSLLDMSVLSKMHQLDKILELIATKAVMPYYQSKLDQERTEVRFLPSWFGPQYTIFYMEVQYHYGFTADEFEAIQRGELNPFMKDSESNPYLMPVEQVPVIKEHPKTGWEQFANLPIGGTSKTFAEMNRPEANKTMDLGGVPTPNPPIVRERTIELPRQEVPPETTGALPSCYGKDYNPKDPECFVSCEKEGWGAGCKLAMEAAERRKTAKRLFKY